MEGCHILPKGVYSRKNPARFKNQKTIDFDDHDLNSVGGFVERMQKNIPGFTFSDFVRAAVGSFTCNPALSPFIINEMSAIKQEGGFLLEGKQKGLKK